jgi:hypothetical protein
MKSSMLACLLLVCALAAGCATPDGEFREGTGTLSRVQVQWSEKVQEDCHRGQGLALMHGKTITGCAVATPAACTIIAARPADFRDELRLVALGHELLHCLGWQHR